MNQAWTLDTLLQPEGPVCLIIKGRLQPVGDQDRFQPAGFPEVGHVLYDAPRKNNQREKVCILDSPASMANHLESVCMAGPNDVELHPDLEGLPYVVCATDRNTRLDGEELRLNPDDPHDKIVVTSLTEGHRIASEYFLDGLLNPQWINEKGETPRGKSGRQQAKVVPAHWEGKSFRDRLREEFGITTVKKNERYFICPEDWWSIYNTTFKYDPNSLVHGLLLAKEQIKIGRLLTAHLEAFGASRVGRSGVKFDRLGKTLSGQPIFSVDEETAQEIRATFILDLAQLRSYGRGNKGLGQAQKQLLLGLALWKIKRLLAQPFRYRSQCYLRCVGIEIVADDCIVEIEHGSEKLQNASTQESPQQKNLLPSLLCDLNIRQLIQACGFPTDQITTVYYPAHSLFKVAKTGDDTSSETESEGDDQSQDEG
ncbi:MAG: type I-U CRISPR-associated protein Cas7 [Candidatus Tectimicrobiota bacterium]